MTLQDERSCTPALRVDPRAACPARAHLLVLTGPDQGTTFPLGERDTLVGRSRSNDLSLRAKTVSGFHVAICAEDGGHVIEDLGSRNGTRVGGILLPSRQSRRLRHGDTIEVGDVLLLFADARTLERRRLGTLQFDMRCVRAEVDGLLGELQPPVRRTG